MTSKVRVTWVAFIDSACTASSTPVDIWVLSNHKDALRKGRVQLIDASAMHASMRKSLGSKRKYLSDKQIAEIAKLHEALEEGPNSKTFANTDFGYRRITVDRPLRLRFSATPDKLAAYQNTKGADQNEAFAGVQGEFDSLAAFLLAAGIKKLGKGALKAALTCFGERDANAQPVRDDKGNLQADSDLREFENVPLSQSIDDYFAREVLPHVPDAWIDTGKTDAKDGQVGIVGYEINFNRYFYVYQSPRALAEIDADLKAVRIMPIHARRLDQAHDRRCPFAAAQRAGKQPVRAT